MRLNIQQNKTLRLIIIGLQLLIIFLLLFKIFISHCFAAELKVTMLDVGQGDSILIQADGENILVDTGDFSARATLLQHLINLNATNIDKLILTHPHSDHIANAVSVPCKAVFDNGKLSANRFYLKYLQECERNNIPRFSVKTGDFISVGNNGAYIEILSAARFNDNINNSSIVCKLVYNDFSMLLAGDAEFDALQLLNKDKLAATVLKSPHHGSKSSNTFDFAAAVKPQFVLISAGFKNKFGHPHKISIRNFLITGVPSQNIFCTAFNGNTTVITDGFNCNVFPQNETNWVDMYLKN